jgi:hypothetical protein
VARRRPAQRPPGQSRTAPDQATARPPGLRRRIHAAAVAAW